MKTGSDATPEMSSGMQQTTPESFTPNETRVLENSRKLKIGKRQINDKAVALEFSKMMAAAAVLYGFRMPRAIEEKSLLYGKIKGYYGHLSISDISLALDLHSVGDLERRVEHYGSFTFDWLSQVLNLYQKHREAILKRYKRSLPPPQEDVTAEANWEDLKKYCQKHGEPPALFPWGKVFYYLEKTGIIDMTDDQKTELFNRKKKEIKECQPPGTIKDILRAETLDKHAQNECRKFMVMEEIRRNSDKK